MLFDNESNREVKSILDGRARELAELVMLTDDYKIKVAGMDKDAAKNAKNELG